MARGLGDRTDFVPSHHGDNVLPCDPLFTRLLSLAHRPNLRPAIRDVNTGVEKTLAELLSDVLALRRVLRASLTAATLGDLDDGKEVFINILAPGGYEFSVGILAALALGAAASAISVVQPVKEATYYVSKARSVAVLVATTSLDLGNALARDVQGTLNRDFVCVPINRFSEFPPTPMKDVVISSNKYLDPNSAGIVIFTSGTTGPPKGAVLRRAAIADGAMSFAEQLCLEHTDTSLHLLPVHHATGIWVGFFPFLQAGACIEFRSGSFDPQWTWDRWKRGGLTYFSGVPTIYMRMMRHYEEHLVKLPEHELAPYRESPLQFKAMMCGTSALPHPINDFWTQLMNGKRIIQRYGATETGVVFNMPFERELHDDIPDGSVGDVTLGVDVKLGPLPPDPSAVSSSTATLAAEQDDPDEGEILVRSFNMFSKYLHDPEATRLAHTPDGYFKSGDIGRRVRVPVAKAATPPTTSSSSGSPLSVKEYHFIVGRASVDIIKSGGYKISALDVERELLALPYTGEVMVVGVLDNEFGQRVAAAITLRTDATAQQFFRSHNRPPNDLKLDDLRADIRDRLAGYKLPTLLRIVHEPELPKTVSGKVIKKVLGAQYFHKDYRNDPQVQVWRRRDVEKQLTPKL